VASKISIGISIVSIVIAVIAAVWLTTSSHERMDQANKNLEDATADLDRIVDKAIVHCQTDGTACDILMPQWLEECKKSEMENIPSCHDGRIEQLIEQPTMMSEECRVLKEIMNQNRYGANNNDPLAIGEFGFAMNDYNELGCP